MWFSTFFIKKLLIDHLNPPIRTVAGSEMEKGNIRALKTLS